MELKISKQLGKIFVAILLTVSLLGISTTNVSAWRAVSSRKINGTYLYAKANLPYFSDLSGGGNWKAEANYKGKKTNNKLKLSWSFHAFGGSVSFNGVGATGSGSTPGASFTVKGSVANASGRVYAHGLCLYIGMDATASFTYGNSYYSTTAHI